MSGSNNMLSGNLMDDCGLNIYGTIEDVSSHTIDSTNLVNGKPLYYYVNKVFLGPSDFANAGQVILASCSYSLISNISNSNLLGISLYDCDNCNVSENDFFRLWIEVF